VASALPTKQVKVALRGATLLIAMIGLCLASSA
jgi:hypothetical protein